MRRALLIGVSTTSLLDDDPDLAAEFTPLTSAPKDVSLVATALRASGYDTIERHAECCEALRLGQAALQGELRRFFAACRPGDTALVYVSCHGATLADRDYLLPADAQYMEDPADGSRVLDVGSLIGADPDGMQLHQLQRGVNVVIFLDICRVEAPRPREMTTSGVWSPPRDVVWVYSCGRGQRSYADAAEGSWFGRSLADALDPQQPPTTLGTVVKHAERGTQDLADGHDVDTPSVETYVMHGQVPGSLELCQGLQEQLPRATLVTESALWEHTGGSETARSRVKDALATLADHVTRIHAGAGAHHDDPWHDDNYPSRFERRIAALVERARPDDREERLSPAETAVLLAAPLVHEAVTAIALEDLRQVTARAAADELDDHDTEVAAAMDDVRRAHAHVQSTLKTLEDRGLGEEATAAEHWLRHTFVADWDRLWEGPGAYQPVDTLISMVVAAVVASAEGRSPSRPTDLTLRRIDGQVRQVLGHLTVEPGDRPRINVLGWDEQWDHDYPPVAGSRWRGRQLAQLIWTAGLLAADPRRMPSVLVDHLGAHERLSPHTVVTALSGEYDLSAVDDDRATGAYHLDIRFVCPHPALHVAMEELAARADGAIAAIRARGTGELTRGLPRRVTTGQLRPEPGRYTLPIERFRLAEDEIRPLLMGTQLYGDRMLAIRELYQNALDACRLRDIRNRYGQARGERSDDDWQGVITFVQGWDEQGRLYIECQDNGTGMSRAKLTSMFARAGKRYEQDPDFVQERRDWRRAGLTPPDLNSRFGIGVFSYFMLADEVVVKTAPVDRYGNPLARDQFSEADIQSGSGLLRITPAKDAPAGGGTRVRLYVAAAEREQPPSLVETLTSLLWVSDYRVEAVELGREDPPRKRPPTVWLPGELRGEEDWHGDAAHIDGTDVWLVQGEGRLLLDGVVIKSAQAVHGYVANLRERHRPEPSVDRNKLLSYKEGLVLEEVLKSAGQCAVQWQEVSLRRLWRLAMAAPRLAVAVLDALPKDAMAVLEPATDDGRLLRGRMPLAEVGCLPMDEVRVNPHSTTRLFGAGTRTHEERLFTDWRLSRLRITRSRGREFLPTGYPDPTGLDALLFLFDPDTELEWGPALRTAEAAGVPLRDTVRALRRYAIAGARVPAVSDVRALADVRPTAAAADLYVLYRDAQKGESARHAPMVWVSACREIPLRECVDLLDTLRTLDDALPLPPRLDEELSGTVVGFEEAGVLTTDLSIEWFPTGRLLQGTLTRIQLLWRLGSRLSGASPPFEEVVRRVLRMSPLGFEFRAPWQDEDSGWRELTEGELLLLRPTYGGSSPWRTGTMSMRQLVSAAHQLGTPLGMMAELVHEAAPLTGVTAPQVPEAAAGWTPPRWTATDPDDHSDLAAPYGPWELVTLFAAYSGDAEDFKEAWGPLEACGLLADDPACAAEPMLRQAMDEDLYALLGFSDYRPLFDKEGATLSFTLSLTVNGETLEQVQRRLRAATRHLPLGIVPPPPGAGHLRATETDLAALYNGDREDDPGVFRSELTIQHLLTHSRDSGLPLGDSLVRLAAFSVLGAPAPPGDLTGPDAEALRQFVPNHFDLAAFDAGLLGPGTLGPLELVLVAGRFGWTLAKVYDRYAPFRCLGLRVTVRRPDEREGAVRPDWRDVVVLTEQLTGRAPALCGEVPADHIALCAEETDLTERAVRIRLAGYADLFGFRVTASDPDEYPQDASPQSGELEEPEEQPQ
ncbi:caspase family protein [Streptomyces sp. NPDC046862]|uniref:HD domain-containing protein n=1 Tax=Streptomyces sp. NPDC046862 TaxID=3154603 RepID=UPI0034572D6C